MEGIGISSFRGCEKIQSVVFGSLPQSLELGEGIADGYLRNLFPDSYATLTNVTLGSAVTELPDGFFDQDALASVAFQDTLEYVGVGAFRLCTGLARIDLPDGVVRVDDGAFQDCASMPSLVIPASVKRLGARVFAGCTALRSVQFLGDAPSADAAAYADAPAELVTYVADGTRGWDGIETSRNLPEAWPAGAANAIATYRLPQPDPSRLGATFLGWWTETDAGAEVRPTTRVVLTGDHTLYAHWRLHGYAVAFDANGGVGEMAPVAPIAGETGWARVEVRLDDASAHEVAWSFVKDDWDEAVYADVAWVDEVSWTPAPTAPGVVGDKGATVTGGASGFYSIRVSKE